MFDYIYDFLSILASKESFNKVKQIILFGSFARGNSQKDSDIDIFVNVFPEHKEKISADVKESLNEFEVKCEDTWKIKGIRNQIQIITDSLDNSRWNALRKDLAAYGITLYSHYHSKPSKEKHFVLIEYSLQNLKQKDKMRFIRKITGYTIKKNKKTYSFKGILSKFNAEKISSSIIVPIENYKELSQIIKNSKVPVKIREFWG